MDYFGCSTQEERIQSKMVLLEVGVSWMLSDLRWHQSNGTENSTACKKNGARNSRTIDRRNAGLVVPSHTLLFLLSTSAHEVFLTIKRAPSFRLLWIPHWSSGEAFAWAMRTLCTKLDRDSKKSRPRNRTSDWMNSTADISESQNKIWIESWKYYKSSRNNYDDQQEQ